MCNGCEIHPQGPYSSPHGNNVWESEVTWPPSEEGQLHETMGDFHNNVAIPLPDIDRERQVHEIKGDFHNNMAIPTQDIDHEGQIHKTKSEFNKWGVGKIEAADKNHAVIDLTEDDGKNNEAYKMAEAAGKVWEACVRDGDHCQDNATNEKKKAAREKDLEEARAKNMPRELHFA